MEATQNARAITIDKPRSRTAEAEFHGVESVEDVANALRPWGVTDRAAIDAVWAMTHMDVAKARGAIQIKIGGIRIEYTGTF
jgi:hypothetical protein